MGIFHACTREDRRLPKSSTMETKDKNYISIGGWMLMTLLLGIPIVNIVMLIVWAVDRENETRRNFALASFIWMAIGLVIGILMMILFAGAFAAAGWQQPHNP